MLRYDNKERLIALIKEHALEVKQPGEPPFVLKSGATSNYYLDLRKLTLYSEGLHAIIDCFITLLKAVMPNAKNPTMNAIGGPCVGADPIVGGLLDQFETGRKYYKKSYPPMRGFLVRKEEKDHGKAGRVIGSMKPGDVCVMIEDVVTSGQTTLDAINAVEEYGGRVQMVIAVVDRLAGAGEAFAKRGVPFYPLLTVKDLGVE